MTSLRIITSKSFPLKTDLCLFIKFILKAEFIRGKLLIFNYEIISTPVLIADSWISPDSYS